MGQFSNEQPIKYLEEAEEAARTKTPKKGICYLCKKSFIELDARGRRYYWCKKCTERMKKRWYGAEKEIGITWRFTPHTLSEQRRLYKEK